VQCFTIDFEILRHQPVSALKTNGHTNLSGSKLHTVCPLTQGLPHVNSMCIRAVMTSHFVALCFEIPALKTENQLALYPWTECTYVTCCVTKIVYWSSDLTYKITNYSDFHLNWVNFISRNDFSCKVSDYETAFSAIYCAYSYTSTLCAFSILSSCE
jgi:hypothetical protein